MVFEGNKEHIKTRAALAGREISERRAATISNMLDEAAVEGLNDGFARRAIARYGADNAQAMRAAMQDPDDFAEFAATFGQGASREIFEMEVVEQTPDSLAIDFHYCPYVDE